MLYVARGVIYFNVLNHHFSVGSEEKSEVWWMNMGGGDTQMCLSNTGQGCEG